MTSRAQFVALLDQFFDFDLHVPSSTDFPILLLNQPNDKLAYTKKEGCIKFQGLGKGRYLLFFVST